MALFNLKIKYYTNYMKKKIILLVLFSYISLYVSAQYFDWAIGPRAGTTTGISYKKFFYNAHAYEVIAGYRWDNGYTVDGLYEYHIDIAFDKGFTIYGGAGIVAGVYNRTGKSRFSGGVSAIIGADYTFRYFPINISVDYKPTLGYNSSYKEAALSIRYTFGHWQQ